MAFSYESLNPRQMEAVNHKEGPVLVKEEILWED